VAAPRASAGRRPGGGRARVARGRGRAARSSGRLRRGPGADGGPAEGVFEEPEPVLDRESQNVVPPQVGQILGSSPPTQASQSGAGGVARRGSRSSWTRTTVNGASAAPLTRRSRQASIWTATLGIGQRGARVRCSMGDGSASRKTSPYLRGAPATLVRPGRTVEDPIAPQPDQPVQCSSHVPPGPGRSRCRGRTPDAAHRRPSRQKPPATCRPPPPSASRRSGRDARYPTAGSSPSPAPAHPPSHSYSQAGTTPSCGMPAVVRCHTSAPGSSPPPDGARPCRPAPRPGARPPRARSPWSAPADDRPPRPRPRRPAHRGRGPAPPKHRRQTQPHDRRGSRAGQHCLHQLEQAILPMAQGPVRGEPKLLQSLPCWSGLP